MCSAPSQTGVRTANSATGGKTAAAVSQTIRSRKPIKEAFVLGFFAIKLVPVDFWTVHTGFLTRYKHQIAYSLIKKYQSIHGKTVFIRATSRAAKGREINLQIYSP